MSRTTSSGTPPGALLALIAAAAVFIWTSSGSLPGLVASHFDADGHVNGYMPRGTYIAVLLVITVLVPLFMVIIPNRALSDPDARIHLPNRDYWLAPERRTETVRFLSRQTATFAAMVVVFLCYVQWLVVRANTLSPATLDSHALTVGLAVFLGAVALWAVRLVRRFSRAQP
jgi:hypothetical protein